MQVTATQLDAYNLIHKGILALARAEQQGMRIDVDYCESKIKHLARKIKYTEDKFQESSFATTWKKSFGAKTNWNSDPQLGRILYDVMGIDPPKLTPSGKGSTDEETLTMLEMPELDRLLQARRLRKIKDTYLGAFVREQVDGIMHPSFNLHTVITYRSCVAKGTKVLAVRDFLEHPDGVPIEDIRAGDHVYCFDDDLKPAIGKVRWAGRTGHKEVIRIHYRVQRVGTGYLDVTPEHLVRLVNGQYVEAQDLVGDFRTPEDSPRTPKIRVLSCLRSGDKLNFTGHLKNGRGVLESRFIYEHFIGPLKPRDLVHHKNGKHLDHRLENLERMCPSSHASHHASDTLCTPKARANNIVAVKRAWREGKYTIRYGPDTGNYLGLTKTQCLRLLAAAGGKVSHVKTHDFDTFKSYLKQHGIDPWIVRLRYDKDGRYISKGRLQRLAPQGRAYVAKKLGHNYYKLLKLYRWYGIPTQRRWGNQHGPFVPGNHIILKIEWIGKKVDVYDIEVEKYHNFIANEICVHNSSSNPNFQNIPKRDKESMQICRRAIKPRPGHQLLEVDFSQLEVSIAACYHKDPTMIKYLTDPHSDMHGDMAEQIFMIDDFDKDNPEHKYLRDAAKNGFVFPQFYGDYHGNNAAGLCKWAQLPRHRWKKGQGIKLPDGQHISDHMINKGIKSYDQFVEHLKEIEDDFWNRRFHAYQKWKNKWLRQYKQKGYLDMLTGFRCSGVIQKNEVINYPVQGAAFHCLLWSFIEIDRSSQKENWGSRLIGQIHDAMVLDVHPDELEHVGRTIKRVTCIDLPKAWKWISVPLDVDAKLCPVDGSWAVKETWKLPGV